MIAILTLVALIFLAVPAVTCAFFWYETANGPHLAILREVSRGRVKAWVFRGYLTSLFSLFLVIATFPMGVFANRRKAPLRGDDRPAPPVLLVHGVYHNSSAWFLLRIFLERAGFTRIRAWHYPSFRPSFDELAGRLVEEIRELARAFPGEKILLVGHSMGGLLIRTALSDPTVAAVAGAVVTLGTPHQGTKLAVFAVGRPARSLGYRCPLIEKIKTLPFPQELPRLALYSPVDDMVLPNSAGVPEGSSWPAEMTAPVGHLCLIYHPSILRRVVAFLKENSAAGEGKRQASGRSESEMRSEEVLP